MTTNELKKMQTWLVWKKQARDGKIAKVPFSAEGKVCGTSEKYKEAWVTYAEAIQAVKVQHMDGVGFRIPHGVFFLDIDHKDLADPLVKKLVAQFTVSVSRIPSPQPEHSIRQQTLQCAPLQMSAFALGRMTESWILAAALA